MRWGMLERRSGSHRDTPGQEESDNGTVAQVFAMGGEDVASVWAASILEMTLAWQVYKTGFSGSCSFCQSGS